MKKLIILICLIVLILPTFVLASTLTFDSKSYLQNQVAVIQMTLENNDEKSKAYTVNVTNGTFQLQLFTGTTPTTLGTLFTEEYVIPSDYVAIYGSSLNATLIGANLEGHDNSTVLAASTSDLSIRDINFTNSSFLSKGFSIMGTAYDENDKLVSGSECVAQFFDSDGIPVQGVNGNTKTIAGEFHFSTTLEPEFFNEGQDYTFEVHCGCGEANTSKQCWNEDGEAIFRRAGTATRAFTTRTWLKVSTSTDESNYIEREEMFICANLTNVEADKRIAVEIFHQARCSAGDDFNADLDRALIFSDDMQPDERGISVGTTQQQCKRFVIPEPKYIQGRTSQCYASTTVWVLDDKRNRIYSYATTSPTYNVTINDVNLDADWYQPRDYIWETIINFSSEKYDDFNASGIGHVDVRLDKHWVESIKAEDQYFDYPQHVGAFTHEQNIKNITVHLSNGSTTIWQLELLDDGNIEIEVRDVNRSRLGGYLNITMEMNNFEERGTEALEGINASAGTFDFVITASDARNQDTTTVKGRGLNALGKSADRDVQITCYVVGYPETEKVFPVFATTSFSFEEEIEIPQEDGIFTMRCEGRDNFFGGFGALAEDKFTIDEQGYLEPRSIVGKGFDELVGEFKRNFMFWFLLLIIICSVIAYIKREEIKEKYKQRFITKDE